MIDVNWNDNAKAAVSAYNDWALENDLAIHAFFEHLTSIGPTQKTVADVEQDGEKWTHVTPVGDPCFIKLNEPDCEGLVLIEIRNYGYDLIKPEQLKPIKSTLTKAEAWDKLKSMPANEWSIHSHVMELENKYDII